MFEELTIGQLLKDLRSVKLRKELRGYVDRMRAVFEAKGDLPALEKVKIRRMCTQYSRQLLELHESRQRAKRTNGLRAMGLTVQEADRRVEKRRADEIRSRMDVGF